MDDAGGPDTGYFAYLDALIDLLNADPQKRFNAFYSSASAYVAAKMASVPKFPIVTADFFPCVGSCEPEGCCRRCACTLSRCNLPNSRTSRPSLLQVQ